MSDDNDSTTKPDRGQIVAATLFVIGFASTVAQFATAAWLGIADDFDFRWSTGGLVALLGCWYMAVKCYSWSDWKNRIWAWIGVVAVLAVSTIYATSSSSDPVISENNPGTLPTSTTVPGEQSHASSEVDSTIANDVRSALVELDEEAFKSTFREALAGGESSDSISAAMGDIYEREQYCILLHWLDDVARPNGFLPGYSDETITRNCTEWLNSKGP